MNTAPPETRRLPSEVLAVALILAVVLLVALSLAFYNRTFTRAVSVTLTSNRSGLVLEPHSKVKMRGVQVGHVAAISGGSDPVSMEIDIDSDQITNIPANVEARIDATSLFGAKYVDLLYPDHPSPQRLAAGAVLHSQNVTAEINTVFNNLVILLHHIDPAKLNSILSALAQGVRGQGERIGQATVDANDVLQALNARTDATQQDFRALKGASDVYAGAATDIVAILNAASTTSVTVSSQAKQVDALLIGVTGLSRSGIDVLGSSKDNLVRAVEALGPTTGLLNKYNPELTCLLTGGQFALDNGVAAQTGGANGKSLIMDAAFLLGDDAYRYPDNLPITGAKGGPGGQPGCGSLPDVAKNWPVRQLISDTGFGTGLDNRPNPGIGFPGIANYFPVTKAIPEPPRIRYPGGPAPGPSPYPGAPPYGAPQYGPDGTPLDPGLPPAAPPAVTDDPPPTDGAPGTGSDQPPAPATDGDITPGPQP